MQWTWQIKVKLAIVLAGAMGLFGGLGFWMIERVDPAGPFVLSNLGDPGNRFLALALLVGMTALCGTIGGLWLHRQLPYVGWLVIGAGWLAIALRSPSVSQALLLANSSGRTRWFYTSALIELILLSGISLLAYALSSWLTSMIPHSLPAAGASAGGAAGARQDPSPLDRQERDSLTDLAANFIGAGALGTLLYILLLNYAPGGDVPVGPVLRGQVLFALAGGFFLSALASHQIFVTRNPWGIIAAVPVTAAVCYLITIFSSGEPPAFAYKAPLRIGWPMPIDFLGLALPASVAGYLVSLRLVQVRLENQHRAASGNGS